MPTSQDTELVSVIVLLVTCAVVLRDQLRSWVVEKLYRAPPVSSDLGPCIPPEQPKDVEMRLFFERFSAK